ncbi:MAG TPA: IS110 family transposase [Propionibacteriaceae bacterium]|nr:IS110 family transposase [Propionibacteriaceae bacterium]
MRWYSGIDLHSNNSVMVVIDDADRIVYRRRLPNELGKILEALEPYRAELGGVVVESTYNWYWLVDGLQAAGHKVHLANTAKMKRYDGLKHGGDETDAFQLAHLLRLGILPRGYIYPKEQRALRDLGRRRMQLVRSRTVQVLAVENVQARETGARMTGWQVKQLDAAMVQGLGLLPEVTLGMQANVAVITTLNVEIARIEKHLALSLRGRADYQLLGTAPGIGDTLTPVILLETGSIERFAAVGDYASYARCVDSVRLSNDRKKGEGNRRNGNKYLAWAFIEAANMARRWCPEARRFHDRKRAKTNAIVATKALAHKLARACYHMLKNGEAFNMQRCFG